MGGPFPHDPHTAPIATNHSTDLRQRRRRNHATWQITNRKRHTDDRGPHLAFVRPVAKTALTAETVVWAHIRFGETDGYKLRPAVVSHVTGRDVMVFPATSAPTRHRYPWVYHEVTDLASARLERASGIRLDTMTVDIIDVVNIAGALGSVDHEGVFGPRFRRQDARGLVSAA